MLKSIVNMWAMINKNLQKGFVLFLLLLGKQSFPQKNGFFEVIKDMEHKSMEPLDIIETQNGDFFVVANELNKTKSKIIKLDARGHLTKETTIAMTDTLLRFTNVFQAEYDDTDDPRYFVLGTCRNASGGGTAFVTMIVDDNLNIMRCSTEPIPFTEKKPLVVSFIPFHEGFVAGVSFYNIAKPYLVMLSPEGAITKHQECDLDSLSLITNLFAIHDNPCQIGMFARATASPQASAGVLVFDSTFSLVERACFAPFQSIGDNGNLLFSYLFPTQSLMLPLPDGNYAISAKLLEKEINGIHDVHDDRSVLFIKTDDSFNIIDEGIVIGHFNDTIDVPAPYKSVSITKDGNIYQCSNSGLIDFPANQFNPDAHLIVTKTDMNLNVAWQRRFLQDSDAYVSFSSSPTADGGCIVVGTVYDLNPEERLDIFVLKINAEGTVGIKEVLVEDVRPYAYYPNPAKNELRLKYSPDVNPTQIELFDLQGRLVRSQLNSLETINLQNITAGTYIIRIAFEDGKVFSDKVVKE